MEPEELAALTDEELDLMRPNLTAEEWEDVGILVKGAKGKARATKESSETFRRGDQLLRAYAPRGFGFDDKDPGDDDRKAMAAVRNDMAAFIQGFTDRGQTPTNPQLIAKVREIYTPFTDGGIAGTGFFEETSTFAEVRNLPAAQAQRFVPDLTKMNPDRVTAIRKTLTGVGTKGTDEQVQQAIKSKLLGQAHVIDIKDIDKGTIAQVDKFLTDRGIVATKENIEQWVGAAAIRDTVKQRDILNTAEPTSVTPEPGTTPGVPQVTAPPVEEVAATPVETAVTELEEPTTTVEDEIRGDEIVKDKVDLKTFKDSLGVPTIGIGFNLNKSGAKKRIEALGLDFAKVKAGTQNITKAQAEKLFSADVAQAKTDAKSFFSGVGTLSETRQNVLTNMAFNLGLARLNKFAALKKALAEKDYAKAAKEMLNSKWAKQVGKRATRLAKEMKEG
jgi:GH24 family phage-related lysozyme (muramidase)